MGDRWVEVAPSEFSHEREGLEVVKALLPNRAPFHAWSNFEFQDGLGKWHEVDLLVLGEGRLHLVELKYYSGTLRGNAYRWERPGRPTQENPVVLARRKAQRLASLLRDAFADYTRGSATTRPNPRDVLPFVQQAVFLHHPHVVCDLPEQDRTDLFGLDTATRTSGLPGISRRLLEPPPGGEVPRTIQDDGRLLLALINKIGFAQRREREFGSWRLVGPPDAEGEGWQDWPAEQKVTHTPATIRFYVSAPTSPAADRQQLAKRAGREYQLTRQLRHDSLRVPVDIVDGDLGPGLVYPRDDSWQRLDLWLAGQPDGVPLADRLQIIRGTAEAMGYAHRNHVVHRGLTPTSVLVRRSDDGAVKVQLGGWQVAGSDTPATRATTMVLTRLAAVLGTADDPEAASRLAAYQAPEGLSNPAADRVRLDLFALGAVASFVLTGRPPADSRAALRDRLTRDDGIDVAADLPEVGSAVRALVLEATRPQVSQRLADVPAFLEALAAAEREAAPPPDAVDPDPLDSAPGTLLAGRFELVRRLGSGSTAAGLLVTDHQDGDTRRVLKVALDASAARRLDAEAQVLQGLDHARLVRLVEGPVEVGGRRALLLENAGERTLADELRTRARLSLDLLERWGGDLLEALIALDAAGVDHRDVKPSNLGIHDDPKYRVKHLVLFDFSLARAGATAVEAGTPPYLDPFLGTANRPRWDSAAERYSAAVTLFEMATGATPVYGDGSDPQVVKAEATIDPAQFDPAVAVPMTAFFAQALARDAARRHHTAADMLAEWRRAITATATTIPDDADERAAAATLTTPLAEAGLSARALSAVEPLGVVTVGDLLAIEPARISRLSGVSVGTREEVRSRAKAWRDRLGTPTTTGRPVSLDATLDLATSGEVLLAAAGGDRDAARRRAARLLLGLDDGTPAFATLDELGRGLDLTPAVAGQAVADLQQGWCDDPAARSVLDRFLIATEASLAALGSVASADEIVADLTDQRARDPQHRLAEGLLRVALDYADLLERDDDQPAPARRRRRYRPHLLVASTPALLDAVDAAAARADVLVADAVAAGEPLVPASRSAAALREAWRAVAPDAAEIGDSRLVAVAAQVSTRAAASGRDELHDRDLPPAAAVELTLAGLPTGAGLAPREVADRVRARFPAVAPLPERPALDALLAPLGLAFDPVTKVYAPPTRPAGTTGLASRSATYVMPAGGATPPAATRAAARLAESVRSRSFLALGTPAGDVDRARTALVARHDAHVVDVTDLLLTALRERAAASGVPWHAVTAADAAEPGTRDAEGLKVLVARAMPAVEQALQAAVDEAANPEQPVLLVETAPLARYHRLDVLAAWADLGRRRPRAVWVLLPLLGQGAGPDLDGRPLPLAASGQFLWLAKEWVDTAPSAASEPAVPTGGPA